MTLTVVGACQDPPSTTLDGSPPPTLDASVTDASPTDAAIADASVADAARADAAPDATVLDARPVDASLPDAFGPNPLGIALHEMTNTLPDVYNGGALAPNPWGLGSGVAIGDVDGDDDLDVILARCNSNAVAVPGGPTTLLRAVSANPLSFAEDAAFANHFDNTCAHAASLGDFDADGDLDLFVSMDGPDRLFENDGTGVFTDITSTAGVAGPMDDLTSNAVWADVNADGLLDLYVLAQTPTMMIGSNPLAANRLYLNRADGTFEDVSVAANADSQGSSWTVLVADLDNDGDLELYVVNDQFTVDSGPPQTSIDPDAYLDRVSIDDRGVPTYSNLSVALGTNGPRSSMGVTLTDLDGDGWDDLYIADWGANHLLMYDSMQGVYIKRHYAWQVGRSRTPVGYRFISWGVRFVDFDRDGSEEIYVVNGSITTPSTCQALAQMDLFLRRQPGLDVFDNVTEPVGLPWHHDCNVSMPDLPYGGRGVAIGDLDGDGDDDLVISPYAERYRFYQNQTPSAGRHFVRLRLRGTVSSPFPAGTRLQVERLDGKHIRRILYGGGGTQAQSPPVLEAGLDTATAVTSAWVHWPSGFDQRIDQLGSFAIDTELVITEPEWLALSARVVSTSDATPKLTYRALASDGTALGMAGEGRTVAVTRSDGVPVMVTEVGAGVYEADLPHPGSARITVLTVSVDGVVQRPRLSINYQ